MYKNYCSFRKLDDASYQEVMVMADQTLFDYITQVEKRIQILHPNRSHVEISMTVKNWLLQTFKDQLDYSNFEKHISNVHIRDEGYILKVIMYPHQNITSWTLHCQIIKEQ